MPATMFSNMEVIRAGTIFPYVTQETPGYPQLLTQAIDGRKGCQ